MKSPLVYSGPGVYSPLVTSQGVEWQRNTDGDPFVGVEVPNIANVKKFAQIARIEVPKEEDKQ